MLSMKEFYRAKYKGDLFVIKAGGRAIADDEARKSLLSNIQDLTSAGIKVLLIYGGGSAIDAALKEAGIEPQKVDGRRITTGEVIKHVKNVMAADLSYRIGSTMAELKLHGLCLSSLPAAWVKLVMRPSTPEVKRFDATIKEVYADQITNLFNAIPFIACPCISVTDEEGVNINADNVAVAIAMGCKTRKLIFMTDVDGVLVDGETAPYLTDADIPKLIADGTVEGGMKVKLENCIDALNHGVSRIHLLNGFKKDVLQQEIYESTAPTTMIIRESDRQAYLHEIATQQAMESSSRQPQEKKEKTA